MSKIERDRRAAVWGIIICSAFTLSCSSTLEPFVIELRNPPGVDALAGATTLRLIVRADDLAEDLITESPLDGNPPQTQEIPFGVDRVLEVIALQSNTVIGRGTSIPFDVLEQATTAVQVTIWPVGRFAPLESQLAVPRSHHTATPLPSGRVAIIGGFDAAGAPTSSVEVYDPTDQTFTELANGLLTPRGQHRTLLLPDATLLVIGGQDGNGAPLASIEHFKITDGSVQQVTLGQARVGHTATLLRDGKILIVGGQRHNGVTPQPTLYDPDARQEIQLPPVAGRTSELMNHHAAIVQGPQGERVLLSGGISPPEPGGSATAQVLGWHTNTRNWIADLPDLPEPRFGATAFASDQVMILIGGGNDAGPLFESVFWRVGTGPVIGALKAHTHPYQEHAAMAVQQTAPTEAVLIAGGAGNRDGRAEVLEGTAFRPVGDLVHPRSHFTITAIRNFGGLVVGGLSAVGAGTRGDAELILFE